MPIIRIDFDDQKVTKEEIIALSEAAQTIVADATGIKDVFVYANSAQIKLNIAPIELFVEMSAHKVKDEAKLVADIKTGLAGWKKQRGFSHPINFTFLPMNWKVEIGI